jgi:hypothetical protein
MKEDNTMSSVVSNVVAPSVVMPSTPFSSVTFFEARILQLFARHVEVLSAVSDTLLWKVKSSRLYLCATEPEGWCLGEVRVIATQKREIVFRNHPTTGEFTVKIKAEDLLQHIRHCMRMKHHIQFHSGIDAVQPKSGTNPGTKSDTNPGTKSGVKLGTVEVSGSVATSAVTGLVPGLVPSLVMAAPTLHVSYLHTAPPYETLCTHAILSLEYRPRAYYVLSTRVLKQAYTNQHVEFRIPAKELTAMISQLSIMSGTHGGICRVDFSVSQQRMTWTVVNDDGHKCVIGIASSATARDVPWIATPTQDLSCSILITLLKKAHLFISQSTDPFQCWLCPAGLLLQAAEQRTLTLLLHLQNVSHVDWASYT